MRRARPLSSPPPGARGGASADPDEGCGWDGSVSARRAERGLPLNRSWDGILLRPPVPRLMWCAKYGGVGGRGVAR